MRLVDNSVREMEISVSHLRDMLDSISRFHFLSSNINSKCDLVQTYCQEIDEILHVLEPVVDEIISNEVALDEQLNTFLEDLCCLVNAAREQMEKWNQLTSKVWFVLQIEELVAKFQASVLGFCKALGLKHIDHCIEKIQSKHYKETSTVIRETMMCSIPSPDHIVKIAHSLSLLTIQELLMERIALDNLKQNIDPDEDHRESTNCMIKLISHMHDLFVEKNQVKSINSVAVPADICCPLSLKIMSDPVIVASGQTYERAFIRKWLDQGLAICPKSWQVLSHTILIPNAIVKSLIANWCHMNNIKLTDPFMHIDMNQPSSFYELAECSGVDSHFTSSSNPRLPDSNGCQMNRNEGTLASDGSCQMVSQNEELTACDPSPPLSNSFTEDNGKSSVHASKDKKHGMGKQHYDPKDESSCHSERHYLSKGAEQSHVRGISSASSISGYNERKTSGNTFPQFSTNPCRHTSNILSEVSLEAPPSRFHKEHETSTSTSNIQSRSRSQTIWLHPSQSFSPSISFSLETKIDFSSLETHIHKLIEELKSDSVDAQRSAASELLTLTRHDSPDNIIVIANCGAIAPLISLLSSDMKTQETAVTALLNLSLNDNNKTAIAKANAIDPLIHVLKTGSPQAKQNSAAALYNLSFIEENKVKIGRSGAIGPLVELLGNGNVKGKKDALTAVYNLSLYPENKVKIVQAEAVKYLVELMDPTTGMVDRAVAVLANLATTPEGRSEIGQKGGIPALVDVIELGSSKGKENAAAALLHLCTNSNKFCKMVLQEGAIPPLVVLLHSGTLRAKKKAQSLLDRLRSQKHASFGRS